MTNKIKAMVMAAGMGSRLEPITLLFPKPLIPVMNRPLMDIILSQLHEVGVDEVISNTYYLADQIINRYKKNDLGVKFSHIKETELSGTAGGVKKCQFFFDEGEDFVVMSGDILTTADIKKGIEIHKNSGAIATIGVKQIPHELVSHFGVVVTDENGFITEFQEKPPEPKSNLASMGIYIFSWPVLKEALIALRDIHGCDFGKHIIPYCHGKGDRLFAYEYNGYWKDVGTLGSYWEANMELIDIIPEFNLYEEFWKIYTNSATLPPQYISSESVIEKSIISNGCEIYGEVRNCVIGAGVTIGKGSIVRDSIIMQGVTIGNGCVIDKAIIAEGTEIGNECTLGIGSELPNKLKPSIYSFGLVTIGENSWIPNGIQIGKNTAISGVTVKEDYPNGLLESGETLIKAGEHA